MAFLFMDGFSHYQTSDLLRKWTTKDDSFCTWAIVPGEGRNGGCIKRTSTANTNNSGYLNKAPTTKQGGPWSPTVSGVCGFAVKIDDLAKIAVPPNTIGFHTYDVLFGVYNGAWGMFSVGANPDGTLTVYTGNSGTPLGTSTGALINNTWTYLEFKWTLSETAGSLVIKANGITILTYSGVLFPDYIPNPKPSLQWTSIAYLGMRSTSTAPLLVVRACDFYLLDLSGTVNNDFLGDVTINYIIPDANGTTIAWTPSTGTNFSNVDEVPPTDDTDYNSATAVGTLDLYSFTPVIINPLAAQQCILSRRTAPGSATLESVYRQGVTNYTHVAPQAVVAETYNYVLYPYDTNPATTVRFLASEINANQFGVNKAS